MRKSGKKPSPKGPKEEFSRTLLAPDLLLAVMDETEEKLVNARVIGKLRMEGGRQGTSLPHYNGVIAFGCEYFYPVAHV